MSLSTRDIGALSKALQIIYTNDWDHNHTSMVDRAARPILGDCHVTLVTGRRRSGHGSIAGSRITWDLARAGCRQSLRLEASREAPFTATERFLAGLLATHFSRIVDGNRGIPAQAMPASARTRQPADDAQRLRCLGLTARESEVVSWLVRGRHDNEIAAALGTAPRTIGKHVENIRMKLGTETRFSAAVAALEFLNAPMSQGTPRS